MALGISSEWDVDPTMYQSKHPIINVTADIMYFWVTKPPGPKWKYEILLVLRSKDPFKDQWALPGGFIETSETTVEGALRELREETGIEDAFLHFFNFYDRPDRDPRGRIISFVYYYGANILRDEGPPNITAGDDAAKAAWFDVEEILDSRTLAFDHGQMINDWWSKFKRNW